MGTLILVVHLMLAVSLVCVVLLQRSEGGGLGMGGGSMGGVMTARGTANLLSRTTAVLAGMFMLTSLTLAIMASGHSKARSIADQVPAASDISSTAKDAGSESQVPTVPLSK